MLAVQEILEASQAQRDGHLPSIKGAILTAIRGLQKDPGVGSRQERDTLISLLLTSGQPRDELLYEGLEFEAITEIKEKCDAAYFANWAKAVAIHPPPPPEQTARAIAAHMLDTGFHSDFLHRWWTRRIRAEREQSLARVLEEAAALVKQPEASFTVLVAFSTPLVPPRGLLAPLSWIDSTRAAEWLRANGFESEGIRQQGGSFWKW
jgi:hypothetical protein